MNLNVQTDIKITEPENLKRNLKARHLLMISIGGTIGTGLFLGAGQTINLAGPLGAVIAYLAGGIVMYLVMLCYGELVTAMPVAGSFETYTAMFVSPPAGFAVGWLYSIGWVTCIAADITAAGIIMHSYFVSIPVYCWCILFLFFLVFLNLLSVQVYGEAEFWFAGIKVAAIIGFILIGLGAIVGIVDCAEVIGFTNLLPVEGVFPHGVTAVFMTMIVVIYSFQGTELIGVAAGECEEPEKNIPKALRGLAIRIIVFFVFAIFILAATIPWQKAGILESPFTYVLKQSGIPYAGIIMDFVILTAALSAANSGLYASSRLLWSMAQERRAPGFLGIMNEKGVPINGVIITAAFSSVSLLTSIFTSETVFIWLISCTGLSGCITWMFISLAQINFRKRYLAGGGKIEELVFRTPFYPVTPILAFVANLAAIMGLYFYDDYHGVLIAGSIAFVIIFVIGTYLQSKI